VAFTDIIEPLNSGTCSRTKATNAAAVIDAVVAFIAQRAMEKPNGVKTIRMVVKPQRKLLTHMRSFRPTRLTSLPEAIAPKIAIKEIVEKKKAAVLAVTP
jgi:hypothetical protein